MIWYNTFNLNGTVIHMSINNFRPSRTAGYKSANIKKNSYNTKKVLRAYSIFFMDIYFIALARVWGSTLDHEAQSLVSRLIWAFITNQHKFGYQSRGVISTFFLFFNATVLLKNWKKQHFICSNLTLFIVPFFLVSLFFSFLSLFSVFFHFFLFLGGDGPPQMTTLYRSSKAVRSGRVFWHKSRLAISPDLSRPGRILYSRAGDGYYA